MSLLKYDPSQTVITDYYKTIDEVRSMLDLPLN